MNPTTSIGVLDQNYHRKSVSNQNRHDDGWAPTSYLIRKLSGDQTRTEYHNKKH